MIEIAVIFLIVGIFVGMVLTVVNLSVIPVPRKPIETKNGIICCKRPDKNTKLPNWGG